VDLLFPLSPEPCLVAISFRHVNSSKYRLPPGGFSSNAYYRTSIPLKSALKLYLQGPLMIGCSPPSLRMREREITGAEKCLLSRRISEIEQWKVAFAVADLSNPVVEIRFPDLGFAESIP